MKKHFPLFVFAILLLIACQKQADTEPASADNYQPTKAGTTWTYEVYDNKTASSKGSFTVKALGTDTLIEGRTFKIFSNSGGNNDYYNQTGIEFRQHANFEAGTQKITLLYLKDAPQGTVWTETKTVNFSGAPFQVTINYQILEKGISYSVPGGSLHFPNVIHVKATLGAITYVGGTIVPDSDFHYYYAKDLGRIFSHTKLKISVPPFVNIDEDTETRLKSFTP